MEARRERYTPMDVGPTPADWKAPYLRDISSLITNGFVGTATPHYTDRGGVKYLYGTNVRENEIDLTDVRQITHAFHQAQAKTTLRVGDLLTVQSGHIGTTAVVPQELDGANCHALIVTRLHKEKVVPQFLSYYLNSHIGKARMKGLEVGSTILHINTKDLKKFRVLLPPLPEQQKIVRLLATWDKAIATVEKLIENSKAQKKALMQQLLTGKRRLSEISAKWQRVSLSSVANITMGSSPHSESYNEQAQGLPLIQGNADIHNRQSAPRFYTSQITKICTPGDLLLSVRAPVGTVAVSTHQACIGRGVAAISAKPHASLRYLYHSLLAFEPKWGRLSQGSIFEAVNSTDVKNLSVSIPASKRAQVQIAQVLDLQDKETEKLTDQINNLRSQKTALMQQLLTGKRRVNTSGFCEPDPRGGQ